MGRLLHGAQGKIADEQCRYKSVPIKAALAGLIHEMSLLTSAIGERLWECAEKTTQSFSRENVNVNSFTYINCWVTLYFTGPSFYGNILIIFNKFSRQN